jgi:hypothetical protein
LREDKVLLTRSDKEPFTLRSETGGSAGASGSGSAGGN